MLAHGCPELGLEDDVSEADVSEDDAFDASAWPLPCFGGATSPPSGLTGSTGAALLLGEPWMLSGPRRRSMLSGSGDAWRVVMIMPDESTCTPMRYSRARSEEHTSELQSLMRISYAVFCLKKKKQIILCQTLIHIQ